MAAAGAALRALTGPWQSALTTLTSATTVSTSSPERVVLAVAGLLAWVVWAWGAVGLVLTAGSAAPGLVGALARGLARLVVPASVRTAAGLALGVGLVVAAPPALAAPAAPAAAPSAVAVPDWPSVEPGPATPAPPDWPPAATGTPAPTTAHVVTPGDCLWRIAEERLTATGSRPTDAAVARAVDRWWSANADVIGPDPDLIRPGQVLLPPTGTSSPPSIQHAHRSTR
jgi:nucleoid-associated protein YgaU